MKPTSERQIRKRQKQALTLAAGCWDDASQAGLQTAEDVRRYLEKLRQADQQREARLEALRGSGGTLDQIEP